MKLVTYQDSQGRPKVGIHVGSTGNGSVIDASSALEWLTTLPGLDPGRLPMALPQTPLDMLGVIREQAVLLPAFHRLIEAQQQGKLPSVLLLPESTTRFLAPIPRPLSMRDGYAFRQHVESARRGRGLPMIPEFDHFPIFYYTNHLSVVGPGPVLARPLALERCDYELEVAIVIGKEGRNISASRADEHVFGFMVMNDWSARGLQTEEMKLNLGPAKGKDFATALGPYLVTRDELADRAIPGEKGERHDLRMQAFINGKRLSDGNLRDMSWTFAQIIERASYGVTLHPGEVIGSGTVGTGCLMELNGSKITDNLWLKPGDQVVMEVAGLGRLENTLVEERE